MSRRFSRLCLHCVSMNKQFSSVAKTWYNVVMLIILALLDDSRILCTTCFRSPKHYQTDQLLFSK